MEVEGDHTYTVNGAVVHNCFCYWSYVLGATQPVLDELREEIRSARRGLMDLVGPVQVEAFTQMLLRGGIELARVVAAAAGVNA